MLPGEDEPVPSNKVEGYLNEEFWHYYKIYDGTKHCGPPLPGVWPEWPAWVPQLVSHFDSVIEFVRAHNEREAHKF